MLGLGVGAGDRRGAFFAGFCRVRICCPKPSPWVLNTWSLRERSFYRRAAGAGRRRTRFIGAGAAQMRKTLPWGFAHLRANARAHLFGRRAVGAGTGEHGSSAWGAF